MVTPPPQNKYEKMATNNIDLNNLDLSKSAFEQKASTRFKNTVQAGSIYSTVSGLESLGIVFVWFWLYFAPDFS